MIIINTYITFNYEIKYDYHRNKILLLNFSIDVKAFIRYIKLTEIDNEKKSIWASVQIFATGSVRVSYVHIYLARKWKEKNVIWKAITPLDLGVEVRKWWDFGPAIDYKWFRRHTRSIKYTNKKLPLFWYMLFF